MRFTAIILPLLAGSALAQLPAPTLVARATPRAAWTAVTSAGLSTGATTGTPTPNATFRCDNPGAASQTHLYVFGGSLGNNTATTANDLWAFDALAGTFTQLIPDGAVGSPAARGRACIAWNPLSQKVVLFGGDTRGATPTLLNDTWEYDPSTNTWTNLVTANAPSARRWAAMAFDPATGGMVLFGGETAIPPATTPPTPPTYSNETWLLLGGNWQQLTPSTTPPARSLHSMVTRTDAFQDVLLCGGSDNSILNANNVLEQIRFLDVWRWTGTDWSLLSNFDVVSQTGTTFPASSLGNQAVYDPLRSRLVLQGGNGHTIASNQIFLYGSSYGGSPTNYTSEFDSFTNSWTIYASPTTGTTPFNNNDAVIGRISRYFGGFVAATGKVYKACGQDPVRSGSRPTYSVYQYQATAMATATSYGAGCTGSAGPLALTADTLPWTTRTFAATGTGYPANALAFGLVGFAATSLPLNSLSPLGVAGCDLLVSADVSLLLLPTGGSVVQTIGMPSGTAFVGTVLRIQQVGVELNLAAQPTALTSTNALAIAIGAL